MIELGSKQYFKVTAGLALGSFIVFCNLYLFQPMLPYMADHFGVTETQVNWLFAATTLVLAVSLVPWAISSEAFGRRRILLIGLFSIPMIGALMLIGDSLLFLIAARALMGLVLAAFASVAVAYMVEELSPTAFTQAIGGYIAANSLGGITGRILGGVLTDSFSWQWAVGVIAVFSLFGAIAVYFLLPKQKNFTPQRGMFFHHNRALITHIRNKTIWLAMLIGGVNFALFVNLYSVMGFRLVSEPHNLPISLASLIFLCYLAGTFSSKLSGRWSRQYNPITGMSIGAVISMLGMWIAVIDELPFMILGLMLISFGAFFTHTLAYGWVSQQATTAKATATAMYLGHYYIGGSLGGFMLLYCWQVASWSGVITGGMILYALVFFLCFKLQSRQTDLSSFSNAKT